ncbi:MAG: hypothetical protein PHI83_10150 [Sphaerochaetaceae bacterium]|nr:hypothetical protein [Sphaerochaetaceae bacterium]
MKNRKESKTQRRGLLFAHRISFWSRQEPYQAISLSQQLRSASGLSILSETRI